MCINVFFVEFVVVRCVFLRRRVGAGNSPEKKRNGKKSLTVFFFKKKPREPVGCAQVPVASFFLVWRSTCRCSADKIPTSTAVLQEAGNPRDV